MSSVDNTPGFTNESFDSLRVRAEKAKSSDEELIVRCIFDEMFIRQHSQWDKNKKEFLGHIAAGKPVEYEVVSPLSKEVLLLMVSGISGDFKIPIAYFFTAGLVADEKAAIFHQAIVKLHEIGVTIASFTFDGARVNIATMNLLGAKYDEDKPYIYHPCTNKMVYLVLDPPHMIKLIRNSLGRNRIIYDVNNKKIEWKFIEGLVALQISENINLSNKLTKTHVEYKNKKMNVRLACESISNSVASALEFLDKHLKDPNFVDVAATAEYMRQFNNLFDVMNAKKGHTDNQFKIPFSDKNIARIQANFEKARNYISGLQVIENLKKKSILKTDSKTPYFGFYMNTISIVGIYNDYVKPSHIQEFFAFSISQDHVESFFGCIRQRGGHNCNPTSQQFMSAYRRLLLHNEVISSDAANCENDITKILEVSSGTKKKKFQTADKGELQQLLRFDDDELDPIFDYHTEDEENDNNDYEADNHKKMLKKHSEAYQGTLLEKRVIRKMSLKGNNKCHQCMNVFNENPQLDDNFITFLSNSQTVKKPCIDTVKLIQILEKSLKKYSSQDVSFDTIITHILQKINMRSLYESSMFGQGYEHGHKQNFIKLIIEEYFDMKSTYISKLVTRMAQKKLLRHDLLKEVHRAGQ